MESLLSGKIETKASLSTRIPNNSFEAPDPVALATGQSFALMEVGANDPIFVIGADIQVAFYATGLPEPFQDMFALDSVEAWEIDFARVVDQGIVGSWNDVVYTVLVVVPVGWNQALNVCQWVHKHTAETVSGMSAANRCTNFVAIPPWSPLVHTEYLDEFRGPVAAGTCSPGRGRTRF